MYDIYIYTLKFFDICNVYVMSWVIHFKNRELQIKKIQINKFT